MGNLSKFMVELDSISILTIFPFTLSYNNNESSHMFQTLKREQNVENK